MILLAVMTALLLSRSVQTQDGLDTTRGPLVEKSCVIPLSQTHDTTYCTFSAAVWFRPFLQYKDKGTKPLLLRGPHFNTVGLTTWPVTVQKLLRSKIELICGVCWCWRRVKKASTGSYKVHNTVTVDVRDWLGPTDRPTDRPTCYEHRNPL